MKQDFHGKFLGSTLHGFLLFSLASLTESCLFLSGLKDLFPLHMMDNKVGPGSTHAGQIRAKELNVFTVYIDLLQDDLP